MNAFDYRLFYPLGEVYKAGKDCYGYRGQWRKGDFIIHWPAQTVAKRLELCDQYEPQIVR